MCWRSTNHAYWCRLAGNGRGVEQGYCNCRWIPPDLEAKAQHYKNGVGSLPSNKEAKRELKVKYNNETLPFCSEPKYLGVTLDRSLTYRWHLYYVYMVSYHIRITSGVVLIVICWVSALNKPMRWPPRQENVSLWSVRGLVRAVPG